MQREVIAINLQNFSTLLKGDNLVMSHLIQ